MTLNALHPLLHQQFTKLACLVTCFSHGYNDGYRSVTMLLENSGYIASKDNRIGITGTRKGFRNDCHNETRDGFAMGRHMNLQMDHTDSTAQRHYDNRRDYLSKMPANMGQESFSKEAAVKSIESYALQPALENENVFPKTVKARRAQLPWDGCRSILFRTHSDEPQCDTHMIGDLK